MPGIPKMPKYLRTVNYCPKLTLKSVSRDDVILCESERAEHWSGLHVTTARHRNLKIDQNGYMGETRSMMNFFFKDIHCARCHGIKGL